MKVKHALIGIAALALFLLHNPAQAGLVSYWPLDGDATAVEGTDGTLINGPTATTDRNGAAGGALAFDGSSSQYVSVPGGGGLDGATTATVSMWVQWNGTQDNGHNNRHGGVLGRQNNGVFSDNVLCIYNTSNPNASNINWETQLNQGMNSGVQPGDGTWRHIVVAVGPGGEYFAVDGAGVEDRTGSAGFSSDPSIPLTIGAWIGDGGSYSTSRIDDVAVWDRMVSPYQVAALANQLVGPAALPDPIPVAGVAASSELYPSFNRRAANAIDGLGHATTEPDGDPGTVPGMWLSANGDPTGQITFDLGAVQPLDSLALYNYNEVAPFTNRGVQQADVQISNDGVNWISLGTQSFAQAPGNVTNPGQVVPLLALPAQYVKVDILSNYGDTGYTGLNEVEFFEAPAALEIPPAVGVVSTRASSELTAGHNRRAANAVDRVGQTTTEPNGWPSNPEGMWLSAAGNATGEITFDLLGVHQLEGMLLYNYNEASGGLTSRGVQQAEVLVSSDNVTYTSLGNMTFNRATGDAVNPGQLRLLGGTGARYVRLNILSNYGDSNYSGLNEVEFYGEPLERMPIPGVSVTATSSLYAGGFDRRAVHLVDGTGQFAGAHSNQAEAMHWLSAGVGFGGAPGDDGDPELVFDLGDTYMLLESARIWNYNESGAFTGRGVEEMEILVSEDGVAYDSLGTFGLARAPGIDGVDFSEILNLYANNVRYVKFDILSNYNGMVFPTSATSPDNAFVGLSEVQFYGRLVPEPSTLSLAGLGLIALAGYGWTRRRRAGRPSGRG